MNNGSKEFDHFILTRMSLFNPKSKSLTDAWYLDRIAHIERIWAPSIEQQSCRDFGVFGYLTQSTPNWFVNRLARIPWLTLAYKADGRDAVREDWQDLIRPLLRHSWVITTRLDNDDAIHKDFVANLHAQFDRQTCVINFDQGLLLHDRRMYIYRNISNAFISLIEPVRDGGQFDTIYSFRHGESHQNHHVRHVATEHMYLVNVHGFNCLNQFGKKHRQEVDLGLLSTFFGIDPAAI